MVLAVIPSLYSSHPIAHTIIDYAKEKNIPSGFFPSGFFPSGFFPKEKSRKEKSRINEPESFEEYGGRGMSAFYKNK
ncbi:hypothetical protein KJ636_01715, partial [Patescibacteria group bacterium]|nr:hypothetical protein [Patescibacteria group bacterium]